MNALAPGVVEVPQMTPGLTDGEMIVVSDRRSYRNFDADT